MSSRSRSRSSRGSGLLGPGLLLAAVVTVVWLAADAAGADPARHARTLLLWLLSVAEWAETHILTPVREWLQQEAAR